MRREDPRELLKRVTGSAFKAVAGEEEVSITYVPGEAEMRGEGVRLPMPSRQMSRTEITRIRGGSDSLALRMRYHDEAQHQKFNPVGEEARQIFDAVEQARVEALGSRRMAGVAKNLTARVEERCRIKGYSEITEIGRAHV